MTQKTSRRSVLMGMTALGAVGATSAGTAFSGPEVLGKSSMVSDTVMPKKAWDAVVVGAGVFGAWTATHLQRAGKKVLLLDAAGPSHVRASSGGETRMIRSDYGADAIYTKMSLASLDEWKHLSSGAGLPLFHGTGVLFFFQKMVDYAAATIEVHKNLALPIQVLDNTALTTKFPQVNFEGIEFGFYEPEFGVLMARRSVQYLVAQFIKAGGTYKRAVASAPHTGGHSLDVAGETVSAEAIIYACGPWLPKIFPDLVAKRLFVTRQEVAFVASPTNSNAFMPGQLPGWADFNDGNLFYGFPDIEGRGFKIAHDKHGETFDPDTGSRRMVESSFDTLRTYMNRRFPALTGQPFVGDRVCQYTNSSNGDFLMDKHPDFESVYLLGAGSGHGFKHGPEVGRMAADMMLAGAGAPVARFSLASKETHHHRTVI